MKDLIYDNNSFTKGFNHGYELLESNAKDVYDFIVSIKESTLYFDGVKATRQQFQKSLNQNKDKEVLNKYSKKGKSSEKSSKDLER